jgi:hypothetical protein
MILPSLTGVFAAALLGGCAAAPYDTSMNSCNQEYMMTNPASAEYYCGPGYGYPLYEGGFGGFVDIDHFHRHHHDHDHDFHHGGAMASRGHGEAHAERHGGEHGSNGFGGNFQPSGASGSHGGGPRK